MPKPLAAAIAFAALLCCASMLLPAPLRAAEPSKWTTDVVGARQQALREKKPMVLYLRMAALGGCKQLEAVTFNDAAVREEFKDYVLTFMDLAAWPDARERFKIVRVPTVIFYDTTGKEALRAVGAKSPAEFLSYLWRASGEAASASRPVAPTRKVEFAYADPVAAQVSIAGDFNDWNITASPMAKGADGAFHVALPLADGVYEYKFVSDGTYIADPSAKFKRPDGYGANNSVVVVGDMKPGPRVEASGVTFSIYDQTAKHVEVAGTFNEWHPAPLTRGDDGMWRVTIPLGPGNHEYKFVVDNVWMTDPVSLDEIANDKGSMNSLIVVPEKPIP